VQLSKPVETIVHNLCWSYVSSRGSFLILYCLQLHIFYCGNWQSFTLCFSDITILRSLLLFEISQKFQISLKNACNNLLLFVIAKPQLGLVGKNGWSDAVTISGSGNRLTSSNVYITMVKMWKRRADTFSFRCLRFSSNFSFVQPRVPLLALTRIPLLLQTINLQ